MRSQIERVVDVKLILGFDGRVHTAIVPLDFTVYQCPQLVDVKLAADASGKVALSLAPYADIVGVKISPSNNGIAVAIVSK